MKKTSINIFRVLTALSLAALAGMASCSELADVEIQKIDRTYLVVESFLTDSPDDIQSVMLSETVGYFDENQAPSVSNAEVSVNDGESTVKFSENPEIPGRYEAPRGWCGRQGRTYRLSVDAVIEGIEKKYSAVSTMSEPGFQIDSINYTYMGGGMFQMDSLWSISVWGKDLPQTSYFYISGAVNGNEFPYELSMAIDDMYFAGQPITAFPITMLVQTAHNQEQYGECCKFLEEGDVITVSALTLPKDCYEFFMSLSNNSTAGFSIPMLQTQPANCPTNIEGDHAMGFFAACPRISSSVTVTDPFKKF